jgi:hypothetical protein
MLWANSPHILTMLKLKDASEQRRILVAPAARHIGLQGTCLAGDWNPLNAKRTPTETRFSNSASARSGQMAITFADVIFGQFCFTVIATARKMSSTGI